MKYHLRVLLCAWVFTLFGGVVRILPQPHLAVYITGWSISLLSAFVMAVVETWKCSKP